MHKGKKVNELYYARDNNPSFYQFKKSYHFIDSQDRQYMIAVKNRQTFQNTRFKNTRTPSVGLKEPVINNYDFVTLYVKLTDPETKWFGYSDIGKPLILSEKGSGIEHIVILKTAAKHSVTRRTGTIQVKGLLKEDLLHLLNS